MASAQVEPSDECCSTALMVAEPAEAADVVAMATSINDSPNPSSDVVSVSTMLVLGVSPREVTACAIAKVSWASMYITGYPFAGVLAAIMSRPGASSERDRRQTGASGGR